MTRDPRISPKLGDKLRTSIGELYEVTGIKNGYVVDLCLEGVDAGEENWNVEHMWREFMLNATVESLGN